MSKHQKNPLPLLAPEFFQASFNRKVLAGIALGGAATLAAGTALAQSADKKKADDIDRVEVLGSRISDNPKISTPPVDTPRTMTLMTEALMRERGATSLQDVLRTTPGITLGAGEGGTPNGDRPFVRGYEASTDIFMDGVRDYARSSHEIFNLEAVEVIKGASSAFTGRGGTGGSIHMQSKRPRAGTFTEVTGSYGSAGQWRATVDTNLHVADAIALRINAMRMGGGVAGRDALTVDRFGFAPSLTFGLGLPTRLTISHALVRNHDMPDQGMPFNNAANPSRQTPPKVRRENFYGRAHTDFRENNNESTTLLFEHEFNDALQLRHISRGSTTLNHYLVSRPSFSHCTATSGAPCSDESPDVQFQRASRAWWRESKSVIHQTDLQGHFATGPIQHDYSLGFEAGREQIFTRRISGAPRTDLDSLYNPNPYRSYNYTLTYGERSASGEIKTRAFYLIDTMKIGEQFIVNLGARRDRFEVTNFNAGRKDAFWNYQAGLVYKPLPNTSLYANYSTSSNPAGENLGQGGGADGVAGAAQIRDVAPEKSRSMELGSKWDFNDGKLSLAASVFETKKTDARSTDPLTGEVTLSGNNRVRGVELSASGAITDRWHIWAGYTWMDPEVIRYRSGKNVFDGKQMKFIAKQSGTVWTTFEVLPGLTLGGGATYMGSRFANDANTLVLPSHVRYDAMARYAFNKDFSLQFNANNLGNKPLYDASHVGLFANIAPGRAYTLSASYRF
ncbi:TonB-dependent siderophore receptor [Lysobacteraceae bacterium NML71-0210]|nr:TonB-dependent siderophore receptor [Xanthomonadaceae bacterium NML71-0210]